MCHVLVVVPNKAPRRVTLCGKYKPEQFDLFHKTVVEATAHLKGVTVGSRNGCLQSFTIEATPHLADEVERIVKREDRRHQGSIKLQQVA